MIHTTRPAGRFLQNHREAETRGVVVIPTIQFFKSENDHDNFIQYLPSNLERPWHSSGLVGVHVEKLKEALCAISSGTGQLIGEHPICLRNMITLLFHRFYLSLWYSRS